MATNGATQQAFAPVLSALATLQAQVTRSQKDQAHAFLETFQKSAQDATVEAKLFAAVTLKGKITFDIHQIPRDSLPPLRDSLLSLLASFSNGPKPIRTQLCVCLANLAIQMTEWKDVLQLVVSTLGNDPGSIACILEFLHVLPEEVTEGRKINLTEEELHIRTVELLQDNAERVLGLLSQYSQSSASASKNPQLLECITSWLREIPLNDVTNSPLLDTIFNALASDASFDSAVECLSAIFKETRDVDESLSTIQNLYPRIIALRPKIAEAAESEDADMLKGITRIFAEAGEAWVVLIARMPEQFHSVVEAVLECAARDKDRDAISQTFNFWYELKQYLTLEKYMQARLQFVDTFSKLVDIMIGHLKYPQPEGSNQADLFDGDREQEDKFREFRHLMGDVLKDCCEVIGVSECLRKSYELIERWVSVNGTQASSGQVPEWQSLEAPLFSMRMVGRMVPPDENNMLPQLMPLIIQIPDQEKVRFQAVMTLGRYTEWTAQHPATLQPQLNFIMEAFNHDNKEVVRAAALSFKFFCNDCAELLKDFVSQLQQFYESVIDRLPPSSQEEVTDGVASVLAKLPSDAIYNSFKLCCDPIIKRLMSMAQTANDEKSQLALADHLQLVTTFVQQIQPQVDASQPNPAVQYCQEIFPILAKIAEVFASFTPILERVCRCWRHMVLSYRSAMGPLLPLLADKLAAGFSASRQGCFLWATDSIVREFSDGAEHVDSGTTEAIFQFVEQQSVTFLRALNDLKPEELPDVIEDFFRLQTDVLLFYPQKATSSALMTPVLAAASTSLTLLKEEPLIATLHFLRDFLGYGGDEPPSSSFDPATNKTKTNPMEVQNIVKRLVAQEGEILTQRILTGMMYTFPRDCFPDASGVLLAMFQLMPQEVADWVQTTVSMLPQGSITPQESQRLISNINHRIQAGEHLEKDLDGWRRQDFALRVEKVAHLVPLLSMQDRMYPPCPPLNPSRGLSSKQRRVKHMIAAVEHFERARRHGLGAEPQNNL